MPFSDKFGIPRQAQIVSQVQGVMQFSRDYCHTEILNSLGLVRTTGSFGGFILTKPKKKH